MQNNIDCTYIRFVRIIKLILHLLPSHFILGHIVLCPIFIHIPPIGQSGQIIRVAWTILRHAFRLYNRLIHLGLVNTSLG